ncbi:MAG TPA: hypothetical protein VIY66_13350 [Candidatus Acidoferrales bacterium]
MALADAADTIRSPRDLPVLYDALTRRFLEVTVYQKRFAALPEYIRSILATGFYTAVRPSQIIRLKWRQLKVSDLEGERHIELSAEDTTNNEARTIPLIDASLETGGPGGRDSRYGIFFRKLREIMDRIDRKRTLDMQVIYCNLRIGSLVRVTGSTSGPTSSGPITEISF